MHPICLVMLKNENQNILTYVGFYNLKKAQKSYKRACKDDENGDRILVGENGEWSAYPNVVADIVYLGDLHTSECSPRRSFLNLSENEVSELADYFNLPKKIIYGLSHDERLVAEGTRGLGQSYSYRTLALSRKYLPNVLHNIFRKL